MLLLPQLCAAVATCSPARPVLHLLPALSGVHRPYSSAGWVDLLLSKFKGGTQSLQRDRYPAERLQPGEVSPQLYVPDHIPRPAYALDSSTVGPPRLNKRPEVHDEQGRASMRAACQLAAQALRLAGSLVQPGVTTDHLDHAVHEFIISAGAYPSPLNYQGFPKSICTSVNEVVCHGIPDSRPLKDGDIVNVDVTVYLNGFHGDTNATFLVGDASPAAAELVEVTRKCLEAAISVCGPGVPLWAIGRAIQQVSDAAGMSVVRDFVGHGIGKIFHAAPAVLHHRNWLPGVMQLHQTFTIEPIITLGTHRHRCWPDGWTEVTTDGSLAAQFEHTILLTESGCETLTLLSS